MDIPMGGFTQQSVGPALIELHAGIEKGDKREILQIHRSPLKSMILKMKKNWRDACGLV